MKKSKYGQIVDGDWIQPVQTGYRVGCCDCGLVHAIDFRIVRGKVQIRFARDNHATGQLRRYHSHRLPMEKKQKGK